MAPENTSGRASWKRLTRDDDKQLEEYYGQILRALGIDQVQAATTAECDDDDECCPLPQCIPGGEMLNLEDPLSTCEEEDEEDQEASANVALAEDAEKSLVNGTPRGVTCLACGNIFHHDSNFCRMCGEKRPDVLELTQRHVFDFRSMQRAISGHAIHVFAARAPDDRSEFRLGPGEHEVLRALLRLRASLQQECSCRGEADTKLTALHLAAARGNHRVLRALLAARADIEEKSQVLASEADQLWREQHSALHEAACFHDRTSVAYLLRKRANPNAESFTGATPLHIAAKHGDPAIARMLLSQNADLQAREHSQLASTALAVAVDYGRFPHSRLHILARRCFEDLLLVAQLCPAAASELLAGTEDGNSSDEEEDEEINTMMADDYFTESEPEHEDIPVDLDDGCKPRDGSPTTLMGEDDVAERTSQGSTAARPQRETTSSSWRELLVRDMSKGSPQDSIDNWIRLMRVSPAVGLSILDALTVEPRAENERDHPLPRFARLRRSEPIVCDYRSARTWEFFADKMETFPEWHSRLMRSDELSDPLVLVRLRLVRLPGIINAGVLQALATTVDDDVLSTLAAQAILSYTWGSLGLRFYLPHVASRVVEIIALLVVVVLRDSETYPFCWSIIAVLAHRDVIHELMEMFGHVFTLQAYSTYFSNAKNLVDWGGNALIMFLVYSSASDAQLCDFPELLASVVLCRWVRLMYTFRAFPFAGREIQPICLSFLPLFGITIIVVMAFLCFLQAAISVELGGTGSIAAVPLAAFRFMWLSDGDGIDAFLALGADSAYGKVLFVVGALLYCIITMNLFIAVLGEAYDTARERTFGSFQRDRASICVQTFLRARWPPPWSRARPGDLAATRRSQGGFLAGERVGSPLIVSSCIVVLAVVGWLALLIYAKSPMLAAAVLLALALLSDAVLMQRPWEDGQEDCNYLWILCDTAFEDVVGEQSRKAIDVGATRRSSEGILRSIKRDQTMRTLVVAQELQDIREDACEALSDAAEDVQELLDRIGRLDGKVQEVALLLSRGGRLGPHAASARE
eukprot:TRINITY_DN20326_c0_g1_i1.p1 TRINITY_DN20326_c0_g1~~TRINITY_DN20326_c0_g1_i1.p1  ORF type:complete len:1069 (-),score=199.06 TRINITY_DN20326_c0_g1_i1:119-3229(-)